MSSKPETVTPEKQDIGADLLSYVSGMEQALPQLLASEQEYRPEFTSLNLQDISQMLTGGDNGGIIGLGAMAQQESQDQISAAQAAQAQAFQDNAGTVRSALQTLSPEQAAMVESQTALANDAYARAERPTLEQTRNADQQSREAFASRGRLGDTSSVVSEVLGRESVMAQNRAEASAYGGQAAGMASQMYQSPGFSLLTSLPSSVQQGNQLVNTGLSSVGLGVPQLYDTGTALDIGAQYTNNVNQANIANANASAQYSSGLLGGIGSAATGIAGIFSDRRLKTDIRKTGEKNGLSVYSFRYVGGKQRYKGYMAQEVQEKHPHAVEEVDGFLTVNYSKI